MHSASAPSVPGQGRRCRSASFSTVGVTRGSMMMNLVPAALARSAAWALR